MVNPIEYAAKHCLVKHRKKKVLLPKPLMKLRENDKPYKPKYHDSTVEDLSKPKYRVVSVGTKNVLICTRQKASNIIKVIKNNAQPSS